MVRSLLLFAAVCVGLLGSTLLSFQAGAAAIESPPEGTILKERRDFWMRIYLALPEAKALVHDTKYPQVVYEELNLQGSSRVRGARVVQGRTRWRKVLFQVGRQLIKEGGHADPQRFQDRERQVYRQWSEVIRKFEGREVEGADFLDAAHRRRLHVQSGHREGFAKAFTSSRPLIPAIEEIFRKEGLPVELARLPFVESGFNVKAISKVGASGIWQLMGPTAQDFIQVSETVDERNNPLRASFAAAQVLKRNYESLGTWPLAVTAYNHGRKNLMRIVRQVASEDPDQVLGTYAGRNLGYSSSNFYAQFLAVVEAEKSLRFK